MNSVYKEYRTSKHFFSLKRARTNAGSLTHNTGVFDISLKIKPGDAVSILGPNGAGKSTIFKMLCGILAPSSGEVIVCGLSPIKKRKKLAKKIGVVMGHKTTLFWDIGTRHSLAFCRDLYNIPQKDFKHRLERIIDELKIASFLDIAPKRLSLGQRRLVEIACACIHEPKILMLDEPTLGLDFAVRKRIHKFLSDQRKSTGTTILLVSHNIQDVESITDEVIVIDRGKIVFEGSLESLKKLETKRKIRFRCTNYHELKYLDFTLNNGSLIRLAKDTKNDGDYFQGYVDVAYIDELLTLAWGTHDVRNLEVEAYPIENILEGIYSVS
ncbi:MAG: ATP-binding cassette domain-containing protein [Candidatus Hodarchaeota archaeon]